MEQCKLSLYLNLLYAKRHAATGEYCHNTDFSCLEKTMLKEVEGIKILIFLDRVKSRFNDKLHIINDILVSYGFFIKVFVI